MPDPQRLGDCDSDAIRYHSGRFTTIPASLIEYLVRVKVGRNGMAVIMSLCRHARPDGTFAKYSREKMSAETTLTPAQVSRGIAELKEKLVIESTSTISLNGTKRPDRANFGHIATYRFTQQAWSFIQEDISYHKRVG